MRHLIGKTPIWVICVRMLLAYGMPEVMLGLLCYVAPEDVTTGPAGSAGRKPASEQPH